MKTNFILCAVILLLAIPVRAALNVVCTTTDLKSIVEIVGGEQVKASALCAGGSDPHYLEARPSDIIRVRKADLLVAVGAELEIGWLTLLQRSARKACIQQGGNCFFDASRHVELLEIPKGEIDRSMGDVHAAGNPHFMNDPLRAAGVATALAEKLGDLDPQHKAEYLQRAGDFSEHMKAKTLQWTDRVRATGITKIIGYHRELNYLMTRLGIQTSGYLEPKPGIPPTARHLVELVDLMKSENISMMVIGHFYHEDAAKKVCENLDVCRWIKIPAQVGGTPSATSLEAMVEEIVQKLERQLERKL